MHDLVTVGIFGDPTQAALARNRVESAGIKVVLSEENAGTLGWAATGPQGGVRLQVADKDADAARELLDTKAWQSNDAETAFTTLSAAAELARQAEEDEGPRLSHREKLATRAFKATVCGLIVVFLLPYGAYLWFRVRRSHGRLEGRPRLHYRWTGWLLGSLIALPALAILAAVLFPRSDEVDLRNFGHDSSLVGRWTGKIPIGRGDVIFEMDLAPDGALHYRETGAADLDCSGDWAFTNHTLFFRLKRCRRGDDPLQGKIGGWSLEKYTHDEIWFKSGNSDIHMRRMD